MDIPLSGLQQLIFIERKGYMDTLAEDFPVASKKVLLEDSTICSMKS